MIRIGLLGAQGKMGQRVRAIVEGEWRDRAIIAAAADRGDPLEPLLETDVVIDFSSPGAVSAIAEIALRSTGALPGFVIGSTGGTPADQARLLELSRKTAVFPSSNFSTGVLAFLAILKDASPLLKRLGYAPVIVESHHQHKKDAPSGTALAIQAVIARPAEPPVPTHSIRAGEVIGDHEVIFYGSADEIHLRHFAQDRSIFARGAVDAAVWIADTRHEAGLRSADGFLAHIKETSP